MRLAPLASSAALHVPAAVALSLLIISEVSASASTPAAGGKLGVDRGNKAVRSRARILQEEKVPLDDGPPVVPSATADDCDAATGETWCESLGICHKQWETACPTSAPCTTDEDCTIRLGGCGPYACQCLPYGINEGYPQECPPESSGIPCACAGCLPGVCDGITASCLDDGTCATTVTDKYGCNTATGEEWCESLQRCHQPWETICPTSASCTSHDDCEMQIGGCGPYACQCIVKGVDEDYPEECSPPNQGEPCACARCAREACEGSAAACVAGVCGLAKIDIDSGDYVCDVAAGEKWCESSQECYKEWETKCPTSAACETDDDCRMRVGGCGPYACQCFVTGADEPYPRECSPFENEPCACADCLPDTCSQEMAKCMEGVCGLVSASDSCDAAAGETWCESLGICHKQWETACPTSASCSSDDDCQMHIGGCGPYGCQCFAYGINEPFPQECSPFEGDPCMCAACTPDTCTDTSAVCIGGVCGLLTNQDPGPGAPEAMPIDENGCDAAAGETWCESLGICHKQWETACPTSAKCSSDDDCQMRIGGCGPYGCKCFAYGINEPLPQECSPFEGDPCACAGCTPDTCSDTSAVCIEGVCGLSTNQDPVPDEMPVVENGPDAPEEMPVVENGCDAAVGETFCESLGICHKQWETICPTSATCSSDDDCQMQIGGCGPYACQCIVTGVNESYPQECSPIEDNGCECAKCMSDTCSDEVAACVEGVCGLHVLEEVELDENGCNAATGETWCESRGICHKQWESACPSTAPCTMDSECRVWVGGCGIYACKCHVMGVNEPDPQECSPVEGEDCSCSDCLTTCSQEMAVCADGVCSPSVAPGPTPPAPGTSNAFALLRPHGAHYVLLIGLIVSMAL